MAEVEKPHHFSKEGRELAKKEKELAVEQEVLAKGIEEDTMIPMSAIEALIEKRIAESMSTNAKQEIQNQPQAPQYYQPKREYDVTDIPELANWEMRDREYELCDKSRPISYSIPRQHTEHLPLQYTNKDTQTVHILRYATNQPSFFVEKQSKEPGSVLVSDIIFEYGRLKVSASQINLQQFLHIHTYKDVLFQEYDPNAISRKTISDKKLKLESNGLVFSNGDAVNRAIASILCPDYVISWSQDILEERLLSEADKTPQKFIDLSNDTDTKAKGIIKSSLAKGDLIYDKYRFMTKNREVLIEVGKNEDELESMVKYLFSGEGRSLYDYLQNN